MLGRNYDRAVCSAARAPEVAGDRWAAPDGPPIRYEPTGFDLMVDDLHASHERFRAAALDPSPIEVRSAIDHQIFTLLEPAGRVITFFSSHASGKPV